jgi:hypothetical protein
VYRRGMGTQRRTVAASDVLAERADIHRWVDEKLALEAVRRAAQTEGETSVAYHKRVLGQQSRCQVIHGSLYYIWDRPLWRIYIQRERVHFEVLQTATSKDVFRALADYRKALKL